MVARHAGWLRIWEAGAEAGLLAYHFTLFTYHFTPPQPRAQHGHRFVGPLFVAQKLIQPSSQMNGILSLSETDSGWAKSSFDAEDTSSRINSVLYLNGTNSSSFPGDTNRFLQETSGEWQAME